MRKYPAKKENPRHSRRGQAEVENLAYSILSIDMRNTNAWEFFDEVIGIEDDTSEEGVMGALHHMSIENFRRVQAYLSGSFFPCPLCRSSNVATENSCQECGHDLGKPAAVEAVAPT